MLFQCEAATFSNMQFLFLANAVREHCLLPRWNDPGSVSWHFFQTLNLWFKHLGCCSVSCQSRVGTNIVVGCSGLHSGVVIGVTVLQPKGLGSIPSDRPNPPCWGALQQDMQLMWAEEMQFNVVWKKSRLEHFFFFVIWKFSLVVMGGFHWKPMRLRCLFLVFD